MSVEKRAFLRTSGCCTKKVQYISRVERCSTTRTVKHRLVAVDLPLAIDLDKLHVETGALAQHRVSRQNNFGRFPVDSFGDDLIIGLVAYCTGTVLVGRHHHVNIFAEDIVLVTVTEMNILLHVLHIALSYRVKEQNGHFTGTLA